MQRLIVLLLMLCAASALAQSATYATREEALRAVASADADQRAEAIAWIASHGTQADAPVLKERLTDDSPLVEYQVELEDGKDQTSVHYGTITLRAPATALN